MIVVEVYEVDGTDVAAAVSATQENADRLYEHPVFVYGADTLDNLAHPAQVTEISKHFLGI
jgi:hypothetical protein